MALKQIVVLSPSDVKVGSKHDKLGEITDVKRYTNIEAGIMIYQVVFNGDEEHPDVITWPLGYGWTVDGRHAPEPEVES
jgi:hypothetical protein